MCSVSQDSDGALTGADLQEIQRVEVQWSKNTEKAAIKVEINGIGLESDHGYYSMQFGSFW